MVYKKCWGCNKNNVFIFSWLAGNETCTVCKSDISKGNPEVTKNYLAKSADFHKKIKKKKIESIKKEEKVIKKGIDILGAVFVVVYFVWFLVIVTSQPGFIVGWIIIGAVYLLFKITR